LGHVPEQTWNRPDCRRIVRQAIMWAAEKSKKPTDKNE